MKLTLQWKWFLGLSGLLAVLLLLVIGCINLLLPPHLLRLALQDLTRNARLVHQVAARQFLAKPLHTNEVQNFVQALARDTDLRISLISLDGTILAESEKQYYELPSLGNHRDRPEFLDAVKRGLGVERRRSETLGIEMIYAAVPALPNGAYAPAGVVRVARPLDPIQATTARVRGIVASVSLLVGLLSMPLLFWLARRYSAPLEAMRSMARRVAQGEFAARAPRGLGAELGDLAHSLDEMADQLAARIRDLNNEKTELAGILAGMTEGVLVVDAHGRIQLLNRALRDHFGLTTETVGKTPLEVFRNLDLDQLLRQPGARELTFLTPAERVFAVNAAPLSGQAGTVIVFHDITRLKQLENLRKDFVANVSHELRTPLSIIKGYIESLLDPEPPDPATTRQFLQTICKHSQRLEALIEDLLSISALESQQVRLQFEAVPLHEMVQAVSEELASQARAKSIQLQTDLPADLPAVRAHRQRLHQVLVNLLDNALKYTQEGGCVQVSARARNGQIECCVADNGPGIAAEDLPRVFERFYRVDKARSRELGGTGLGLSIVKHIIQAHGGRVWAESVVGQGSQFYFSLPLA